MSVLGDDFILCNIYKFIIQYYDIGKRNRKVSNNLVLFIFIHKDNT